MRPRQPRTIRAGRRLAPLALAWALGSAGCLSPLPATSPAFVTLPAAALAVLPERGDGVVVAVQDLRKGVARSAVGSRRAAAGEVDGATIDLKNREALADHLARDVVMLLRERGYRARDSREAAGLPAELVLIAAIERFTVLAEVGTPRVMGTAVVRLEAGRPDTRQRVWKDRVYVEAEKTVVEHGDEDVQEIAARLYAAVLRQLGEKLRAGLPHSAGG